jgi:putative ubiquitin-RnfH superfamily antitoxin RatB of RatAB toxin-antitoxin module
MKVSVAYVTSGKQAVLTVEVPEGSTVQQAIEKSGILTRFPDIDLTQQKVGIYTKVVPLDAPAPEGARIEIYRPIIADPATVKRREKAE